MQPERERGRDAEVAAAAVQRPEQVRVLVRAGGDRARRRRSPAPRTRGCRRTARAFAPASPSRRRASARRRPWWTRGRRSSRARAPASPRSSSAHVQPPPTRAVRASGSTSIAFIGRTSITSPSSFSDMPATEWPPERTAIVETLRSRPKRSAAATSSARAALGDQRRAPVDHRVEERARLVVVRRRPGGSPCR